jgi:hypothetical protein
MNEEEEGQAALALLMGNNTGTKKKHHRSRKKHRKQRPTNVPIKSKFNFPTERDVFTFAKELGMDLEFDSEQQWLIDQALAAELPPLWTRVYNPSGRSYYVREPTKQEPHEIVTWIHPLVPAYSKIFDNILQEQLEAQKAALGIVSDDENEEDEDEGETDIYVPTTPGAPKLNSSQRKKLRASLEDALLFYKSELGDPETEDVRPKEALAGFWDCEPEDVEDMAVFLGIDVVKESKIMWISRMACVAPLPPGWKAHGHGDDISLMTAENKNIPMDDLGELYSCTSWMCKTDAIVAKMALDMHPSHQYFEILLNEAKEELKDEEEARALSQTSGSTFEDEFDDLEELIPCEFRNETGGIYVYNFETEQIESTGRIVLLDDDEDEEEQKEMEKKKKQQEQQELQELQEQQTNKKEQAAKATQETDKEHTETEEIDRSGIERNAYGSEEPSSADPELWNIDNCEVDMLVKYNMGGQMWYLQSRMRENTAKSSAVPIPGFPMNNKAHKAKRYYVIEGEGDFNKNSTNYCDGEGWKKIQAANPPVATTPDNRHNDSKKDNHRAPPTDDTMAVGGVTTITNDHGAVVGTSVASNSSELHLLISRLNNTTYGNKAITKEQIIDFATHLDLDVHNRKNDHYLHIVEDCFVQETSSSPQSCWYYRADPNGNYHYFKQLKDPNDIDLTQGEEPSGWDIEEKIVPYSMQQQQQEQQQQKKADAKKNKDVPISTWKHPHAMKYKKIYAKEKFHYEENIRIKRVKGLRQKSSLAHQSKLNQARAVGGQHILLRGHLGEDIALSSPTQNVQITKPDQADIRFLCVSPSKRAVPLQPGFSDVKLRKLKQEKKMKELEKLHSSNNTEQHTGSPRSLSPIQNLLREGQQLNQSGNAPPKTNNFHRAFRDCSLSDTAEIKRQREEDRRVARRKKRIDHSKNNREQIKMKLDQQAYLAKSMSSPSFPPLQLDAKTNLGVISLSSPTRLQKPNKPNAQDFMYENNNNRHYVSQQQQAEEQGQQQQQQQQQQQPRRQRHRQYGYEEVELDVAAEEDGDDETVEQQATTSIPKKGLLSPSHQGRFAAMGNLVPVSSQIWMRAHGDEDCHNQQQQMYKTEEEILEKNKLEQFKKSYDDTQKDDDHVIDQWLGGQETTFDGSDTSLSFSVGTVVTKNVHLLPMINSV